MPYRIIVHIQKRILVLVCTSTITQKICEFISEAQLDTTKLRGIRTDGASTMIGCHNGVVACLKESTPSAISVHCAAHRLNLASSQAGDTIPHVKTFNSILRQLFDYFANSSYCTSFCLTFRTFLFATVFSRWLIIVISNSFYGWLFTEVLLGTSFCTVQNFNSNIANIKRPKTACARVSFVHVLTWYCTISCQ